MYMQDTINLRCYIAFFVIQVLGATLDGSSVNCWLIKVHSPQDDVVYKIANPFAQECCNFHYLADPQYLIKTVRNC